MQSSNGFTLLELLVSMSIVGILAAVAVPNYGTYKTRGHDARSQVDLREGIVAQEAFYVENETYVSCADTAACEATLPDFRASNGVELSFASAGDSFSGSATHPQGSYTYTFDSLVGEITQS